MSKSVMVLTVTRDQPTHQYQFLHMTSTRVSVTVRGRDLQGGTWHSLTKPLLLASAVAVSGQHTQERNDWIQSASCAWMLVVDVGGACCNSGLTHSSFRPLRLKSTTSTPSLAGSSIASPSRSSEIIASSPSPSVRCASPRPAPRAEIWPARSGWRSVS
eukprot:1010790-Rhodomonas_salina.3